MIKQHWRFDKSYVIMQLVFTPLGALTSLIAAYLPKIVLDCVESKTAPSALLLKVGLLSVACIIFTYLKGVAENKNWCGTVVARDVMLNHLICEKTMSMDYNNYVIGETRVKREKAWEAAHTAWEGAVARFLGLNTAIFSSLFGIHGNYYRLQSVVHTDSRCRLSHQRNKLAPPPKMER